MSKFKIKEDRRGFTIWVLTNMGEGYAWFPLKRRFGSKQEAERYINEIKVGAQAFI